MLYRMDTKFSSKWYLECNFWKEQVHKIDWDLGLCWKCFDRTCKCYCLEIEYNGTREDYIYNLNKFKFLFRELDSSVEDRRIFSMKKDKKCTIAFKELDYVSDI